MHVHCTFLSLMASFSSTSSFSLSSLHLRSHRRRHHQHHHLLLLPSSLTTVTTVTTPSRVRSPLLAYKKPPNYPQEAVVVVPDPRAWIGDLGETESIDDEDEDEEEEEDDRSLDLLAKFVENVFRKISRRARKAVRSVLPPSISSKLVRFSVNGVLILAFMWILKAFLEVLCTVGSMVFMSVLFVRGVWSGISYIREQRYYNYVTKMNNDTNAWNGVQPAS